MDPNLQQPLQFNSLEVPQQQEDDRSQQQQSLTTTNTTDIGSVSGFMVAQTPLQEPPQPQMMMVMPTGADQTNNGGVVLDPQQQQQYYQQLMMIQQQQQQQQQQAAMYAQVPQPIGPPEVTATQGDTADEIIIPPVPDILPNLMILPNPVFCTRSFHIYFFVSQDWCQANGVRDDELRIWLGSLQCYHENNISPSGVCDFCDKCASMTNEVSLVQQTPGIAVLSRTGVPVNSKRPLIKVGMTGLRAVRNPTYIDTGNSSRGNVLCYVLDNCRASCSSSRLHFKTRLVMSGVLPHTFERVTTEPFAIMARDKKPSLPGTVPVAAPRRPSRRRKIPGGVSEDEEDAEIELDQQQQLHQQLQQQQAQLQQLQQMQPQLPTHLQTEFTALPLQAVDQQQIQPQQQQQQTPKPRKSASRKRSKPSLGDTAGQGEPDSPQGLNTSTSSTTGTARKTKKTKEITQPIETVAPPPPSFIDQSLMYSTQQPPPPLLPIDSLASVSNLYEYSSAAPPPLTQLQPPQ